MSKPKSVPLDHLRGKKRPVIRYVDVFVDDGVAEAINRAKLELETAEGIARNKASDLAAQVRRDDARRELERLQEEAVENEQVVRFTFRGIGRKVFEKLKEEHPPTDEQQKQAREEGLAAGLAAELTRLQWDADKFPPALIAAASLDPKITHEEAYEIFHVSEDWNEAEATALFLTALSAQQARDSADLGKIPPRSQPASRTSRREGGRLMPPWASMSALPGWGDQRRNDAPEAVPDVLALARYGEPLAARHDEGLLLRLLLEGGPAVGTGPPFLRWPNRQRVRLAEALGHVIEGVDDIGRERLQYRLGQFRRFVEVSDPLPVERPFTALLAGTPPSSSPTTGPQRPVPGLSRPLGALARRDERQFEVEDLGEPLPPHFCRGEVGSGVEELSERRWSL